MIRTIKIETPVGEMVAAASRDGICLLEFTDGRSIADLVEPIAGILELGVKEGSNKHLRSLKKQLREYFKGKRKEFSVPLVTTGTDFQKAVWNNLLKIPFGTTLSYGEQAVNLKNKKSARAVAQANSANRIAILIPCHRIIGSDGSLVGYGGGLERKKWLLNHERKYSGKAVELDLF
jgi:AraC family transcriptional regulator of adaptative response/methylated-DNA-[protein]-cysteine methyltransferase